MTPCDNKGGRRHKFFTRRIHATLSVNTVHLSRKEEEEEGRRRKRGWSVPTSSLHLVLDQYGIPRLKEYRVPWFKKTFRNRLLLHTSKDKMRLVPF